jgi:glycosyltransferase involved in cell wall biosynthesis
MKIAIDAYPALFQSGGVSRYAKSLINALADAEASYKRLVLFYNQFREFRSVWKPESAKCLTRQIFCPRRLLQGVWNFMKWPPVEYICGPIDVFHGLHFVLPVVRKARRVITVHDLTYLKYPNYFLDRNLNEQGYRRELPLGLERADVVIAVSQKTKEDLVELMKFPEERIRVIYEGVEPRFLNHVEGEEAKLIRECYGLTQPYIVYLVGTPEPRKNLKNTVAAAKKAAPQLLLALIGPQEPLQALLAGNSHNTVFLDVVPDAHLPALLSGAQISLYPSLYEGFGLPVIESMACGVPVITSNHGALPEVAGDAALLVDPEDVESIAGAISELLSDENLKTNLKALGIERAAEFTWQKTAAKTLSLYRELI